MMNPVLYEVTESRKIEGESIDPKSLSFKQHVKAVQHVLTATDTGLFPDIKGVHYLLSVADLDFPGSFRKWPAWVNIEKDGVVAKNYFPTPDCLDELMNRWQRDCQALISDATRRSVDYNITACDEMYYHFICIHPFEDGNGRVGRLMRNALRKLCGLWWHSISEAEHVGYLDTILQYEVGRFRPRHRHCYDPS